MKDSYGHVFHMNNVTPWVHRVTIHIYIVSLFFRISLFTKYFCTLLYSLWSLLITLFWWYHVRFYDIFDRLLWWLKINELLVTKVCSINEENPFSVKVTKQIEMTNNKCPLIYKPRHIILRYRNMTKRFIKTVYIKVYK